ncbi:hypothetical protein NLG97_g6604 [Lecanicillium saksenae]|uniref:Uncharacterized protein n=1 Tax=Lecanicillium saksenae TaxID=468837 RepID=A0ACC1QRR8_9HYPO|nr:hypothetical protein NLG97_g6604 [Lecanicillium saksenae]
MLQLNPISSNRPSSYVATKAKATAEQGYADWAEVADPVQRRRIQNRISQRKFRKDKSCHGTVADTRIADGSCSTLGKKVKESKAKAERDARNLEHAGNSYRIPTFHDILGDVALSGLPWGSVSLGCILTRGLAAGSGSSSERQTCIDGDNNFSRISSGNCSLVAPYAQDSDPLAGYKIGIGKHQITERSTYLYNFNSPPMSASENALGMYTLCECGSHGNELKYLQYI